MAAWSYRALPSPSHLKPAVLHEVLRLLADPGFRFLLEGRIGDEFTRFPDRIDNEGLHVREEYRRTVDELV